MIEKVIDVGLDIARRADEIARRTRRLIAVGACDDGDIARLWKEVDLLTDVSALMAGAIDTLRQRNSIRPEIGRGMAGNVTLH